MSLCVFAVCTCLFAVARLGVYKTERKEGRENREWGEQREERTNEKEEEENKSVRGTFTVEINIHTVCLKVVPALFFGANGLKQNKV